MYIKMKMFGEPKREFFTLKARPNVGSIRSGGKNNTIVQLIQPIDLFFPSYFSPRMLINHYRKATSRT